MQQPCWQPLRLQRVHLCRAVTHPAATTLHCRDISAASAGAPENLFQRRPTPVLITLGKHHKHAPSARAKEEHFLQKRKTFSRKSGVVCTKHLLLAPLHFQLLNNRSNFCYVYITHSPNFLLPGKSLLRLPQENLQCQCIEECKPRPLTEARSSSSRRMRLGGDDSFLFKVLK